MSWSDPKLDVFTSCARGWMFFSSFIFFLAYNRTTQMSLIPPVPLILSKLKYHIKAKYLDDPSCQSVLDKLGPYYIFKLTANFRSLQNGTCNELEDISNYIQNDIIRWDCIDTALNMFSRMKYFLKSTMINPGVLRIAICHQPEESGDATPWSDMFVDEFPINVRGIVDEKGVEMTLNE